MVYPVVYSIRTVRSLTASISSARDSMANRMVVIKKIGNPFDSPARVKRTYREIHLMKHLKHDNVCVGEETKYGREH
jgi:serine/threonine protein kinase